MNIFYFLNKKNLFVICVKIIYLLYLIYGLVLEFLKNDFMLWKKMIVNRKDLDKDYGGYNVWNYF